MANNKADNTGNVANLGFERELWRAADALRNNMDAAEYKHVVLGLIFLKYIPDAFEEQHAQLEAERDQGADPEDQDEYRAVNIFGVPKEACWPYLTANAQQPTIGKIIDDAMVAIERDNPSLKNVLPKDYARSGLDKQRLGQLIDLIGNIGLGEKANRSKDILGRVYEYSLSQFASTVDILGGGTPKTSVPDYWDDDIPWFSVVDAPSETEVFVADTEKHITAAGLENSATRIMPEGTTIISARGTVSRVALVGVPMAINQSCFGLHGKAGSRGFFNYYCTRELMSTLKQRAHGSVFDPITRDTLASVKAVVPPLAALERFETTVCPLLNRIKRNVFESRTLGTLRDTLLPKLLSGELRITAASRGPSHVRI